jgi:predicted oxidoreductase
MDTTAVRRDVRVLGRSSLQVFPVGYGCWRFAGTSVAVAREKIEAAVEAGITLFDHADIYGGEGAAEDLFGQVLREASHLRDCMVIATKCGIVPGVPYDSSREHIVKAAEASLRRLRIDVIDLYQIHRPDIFTHPEETADALAQLRNQGKIREVGVSNFDTRRLSALQQYLPFPIATQQPEMSAWWLEPFEDGVIDQCMQERITPLAWSPLGGGRLGLTAEAARREEDGNRLAALINRLEELATSKVAPRSAIALAFLLHHPAGIVPIIGTQQPARIRACAAAIGVSLTRSEWYSVVVASRGRRLP